MSYKRKDIPALIKAFRRAKIHLRNDSAPVFVCHSLDKTGAPEMAKELVRDCLGSCFTLGDYFSHSAPFPNSDKGKREIRIQWCSKIIADLKRYAKDPANVS